MSQISLSRVAAPIVLISLALLPAGCGRGPEGGGAPQMPPASVEVAAAVEREVETRGEWVATIEGSVNALIQPQVSGYLLKQSYAEGGVVRKGQILFEIDARPFEAALAQAKAQQGQAESQVAQAQSQIAVAQAGLKKAELDVQRDTPLAAARAISQGQLETEQQAKVAAAAGVEAAKAAVVTARAGVEAAKAAVAQAELNLGFTQVRSLVDGVAGVAQTQIGNLVKTDTVLTAVSQLDPLRVYFPISEREYLDYSTGKNGGLLKQGSAQLELVLSNGTVYAHKGRVAFADRQVDAQTGTLKLAALFPNPGNVLRPGQFGRVRAATGAKRTAVLVPRRAVTDLQGKSQIMVVGADNKVQVRLVETGPEVGSEVVIEKGLKAGEQVIVEGLSKAMDGAPVAPRKAGSR